jgi:GDP-mannose 6-dehydrogenase
MKIAVFGLGYVGMTTAACLARQGHEVLGVDVSDEKVAIVNRVSRQSGSLVSMNL